jgi:outer membrane lipoprotein-sorting protein
VLIGLACVLVSVAAAAEPPRDADPEEALRQARRLVEVVQRVQSHYRELGAFRAPFELQIVSPTFGEEEAETGMLHVVPPAKMLWDYERPEGQTAVFDGQTWWLISPEDHTVTRHEVDPRARSPLIDLLAGDRELLDEFSGRLVEGAEDAAEGRVQLQLIPRETREDVELVVVTVEPESGVLRRIEVVGPLGGSQVLKLGRPVEEAPLPPERFDVTVPEGYTLLEE